MAGRILFLLQRSPTTPNIAVIPGEVNLFQIRRRMIFLGIGIRRIRLLRLIISNRLPSLHPNLIPKQNRLELDPPLVHTHSVSRNRRSRLTPTPVDIIPPGLDLKLRHAVDGIEQAQEMHPLDGPTHGLPTDPERVIRGLSSRVRLGRELPVRERLPHEGDEFLVVGADQPDVIEHLVQEARGVGAAREPEQVDLRAGLPATGEEAIPADYMFVEGGGQCQVQGFLGVKGRWS